MPARRGSSNAALAGVGALTRVLLLPGSSVASAPTLSLSPTPPFNGTDVPSYAFYDNGCRSTVSFPKSWVFHLKTGIDGGSEKGGAGNCGKRANQGLPLFNNASACGGFHANVDLPAAPAGTSKITVNLAANYSINVTASDGARTPTCQSPSYSYVYNETTWEWNYSHPAHGPSGFTESAEVDEVELNGVWFNSSRSSAPLPNPFPLNSTTYCAHDSGSEVYRYCEAVAESYPILTATLYDANTGVYTPYLTGSSLPAGANAYVSNETAGGRSQSYVWDQGTPSGSNTSTLSSSNATLTTGVALTSCCGSTTSPANPSATWNSTFTMNPYSIWFTGSFNTSEHYGLNLGFTIDSDAYNNSAHGFASFRANDATSGNGFKLLEAQMT
jgi:hypothetical protein